MASFEEFLECDEFMNHMCVKCGSKAALFATPRTFGACPRCLSRRMRHLQETVGSVPEWVPYLEKAGEREALRQAKAEASELSVSFDDFYRCARCSRLIQKQEARYHQHPGNSYSSPHCLECYEQLRVG
jgi:DNA-directed RNA polymerase subunit RPC12/RpoP